MRLLGIFHKRSSFSGKPGEAQLIKRQVNIRCFHPFARNSTEVIAIELRYSSVLKCLRIYWMASVKESRLHTFRLDVPSIVCCQLGPFEKVPRFAGLQGCNRRNGSIPLWKFFEFCADGRRLRRQLFLFHDTLAIADACQPAGLWKRLRIEGNVSRLHAVYGKHGKSPCFFWICTLQWPKRAVLDFHRSLGRESVELRYRHSIQFVVAT